MSGDFQSRAGCSERPASRDRSQKESELKLRMFFRSWWRYQNYQNNGRRRSLKTPPPSYIGTQVSMLADPDYLALSAHQRGQLHGMLLMAATDAGHVPNDPAMIAICLRLEHCDELSFFSEWLETCEGRCHHNPEGFDIKGLKIPTPSPRRAHAVPTATLNQGEGEGKVKGKGKRSSTASSKAPISPAIGEAQPSDDDALKPQSSVALKPTDEVESVLRYAGEVFPSLFSGKEPGPKDRAAVSRMLENSPADRVHSAITLAKARSQEVKPKSMNYFQPILKELDKANPAWLKHISRAGPKHLEEIAKVRET